jgi:hypothetical protein
MNSTFKIFLILLFLSACKKEEVTPNIEIISYRADENSIVVAIHDHAFDTVPTFDMYPRTNFTIDKIEIISKPPNSKKVFSNTYYQNPKYTFVPVMGIPPGNYTLKLRTSKIWLTKDIIID